MVCGRTNVTPDHETDRGVAAFLQVDQGVRTGVAVACAERGYEMKSDSRLQPRWLIGSAIGALLLSAIIVSGPGGVRAQDATPTPTATESAELAATEDTVSEAATNAEFAADDLVAVSDGPLNLRDDATIDGELVTQLATGTRLTIVSGPTAADDYDWYEVETAAGDAGWVAGEFLVDAADISFAAGDLVQVADGPLNVRDDSDIAGEVVVQLETGDTATILSGPIANGDYDWYEVEVDSETSGWVAADFIAAAVADETGYDAGDVLDVVDGPLNVRAEAGTSADVVTQLQTGDTATVISGPESADDLNWYEVKIDSETSGWIASDFVALAGNDDSSVDIAIGDGVRVAVDGANFRSDAGLDAEIVDNLDIDALLLVQDGPVVADGYTWYQVFNYYYGEGWVAGELVTVDPDGFPGE